MRLALLLVVLSAPALAEGTAEVLVLNATATRVDAGDAYRVGIEIQNNGPNAIDCVVSTTTVVPTVTLTKARRIQAGGDWSAALGPGRRVYCKAVTADQVTGAATVVTEVRK